MRFAYLLTLLMLFVGPFDEVSPDAHATDGHPVAGALR